jgi:hypothetical protein
MKRFFLASAALLGCALVVSPAQATLLTPGAAPAAVSQISGLAAGSIASNGGNVSVAPFTGVDPITGKTVVIGNLYFAVYREAATGFLDFLYQIQNMKGSLDLIKLAAGSDFSPAKSYIDVEAIRLHGTVPTGFANPTRETGPSSASLSADGKIVDINFPQPKDLGPGTFSNVVVIKTHVKGFRSGTTTIVGPESSTIVPTFAPGPEPSTLVLFAGSFLGLVGWTGWRRWRKGAASAA